jgi:hypothetical protein
MSSDYGVKVSLPGYNVKTATPEQCVIHSNYDTFKVNRHASPAHFGVVHVVFNTSPGISTTTNIYTKNHPYGYQPSTWVHAEQTTAASVPYLQTIDGELSTGVDDNFIFYATTTQFKIDFVRGGFSTGGSMVGRTYNFRYYIFAEDGS